VSRRWMQFRLEPSARKRGYFSLLFPDADVRYVPIPNDLPLLARVDTQGPSVQLDPADGRLEPLPLADGLVATMRLQLGAWRGAGLNYRGVAIVPGGAHSAGRRFRKHLEAAERHDCPWDGPFVAAHPEIVVGWPNEPAPPRAPTAAPRVAVALHLYYTELWDEFETLLARWRLPFRLFLTHNGDNAGLEARARRTFPDAVVRQVDNSGRDVRPFLLWLEEGAFDEFELVCKLHGKRSFGGGRLPVFGDALRRANLHDLVADATRVDELARRFEASPELGLVGSARFLSASTRAEPKDVLGTNRPGVVKLAERLGVPLTEPDYDFFEGTMFWARPKALAPLARIKLSASSFEPEAGRLDGATEHAVERIFNHVTRIAGYRVETARAD
jgi:hypothetical protein